GRVHERLEAFTEGAFVAEVAPSGAETFYERHGDAPVLGGLALVLGGALARGPRERRGRGRLALPAVRRRGGRLGRATLRAHVRTPARRNARHGPLGDAALHALRLAAPQRLAGLLRAGDRRRARARVPRAHQRRPAARSPGHVLPPPAARAHALLRGAAAAQPL